MPEQIPSNTLNQDPTLHLGAVSDPLEVLHTLVTPEIRLDQENFLRQRFHVLDTQNPNRNILAVEFRGREELPVTNKGEEGTNVHVVLTQDTQPLHTNIDRFGTWAETLTDSQHGAGVVLGNPAREDFSRQSEKIWSIATENNADEVVLHGLGTPEGVIDVALQLIASGYGSAENAEKLVALRTSISERAYTNETYDLMDALFSTCFQVTGGKEQDVSHEEGLMLVALSLAGSPEATEAVKQVREDFARTKGSLDLGAYAIKDEKTGEVTYSQDRVAEAGDVVPAEVINAVREAGLVAVHTTETRPLMGKFVRSTAQFNTGTNAQIPRDSIHFSLNHAVESHVMGDFTGREFTIVAPLAGLLESNGAPAAMADVDTYFMARPGEGLVLADGTIIIEISDRASESEHIIQPDGSWHINSDLLHTTEGVTRLAQEIKTLQGSDAFDNFIGKMEPTEWLARELEGEGRLTIENILRDAEKMKPGEAMFDSLKPEEQTKYIEQLADAQSLNAIIEQGGSLSDLLANPDILGSNNTLRTLLKESIRKVLVSMAIKKQGGQVVRGGSNYTFDTDFQNKTIELAKRIGVPVGLHSNMPEAIFERNYGEALYRAQERATIDDVTHVTDFNWPKFDSSRTWYWLSRSSSQTRARAMELGLVTFAKKQPRKPAQVGRSFG